MEKNSTFDALRHLKLFEEFLHESTSAAVKKILWPLLDHKVEFTPEEAKALYEIGLREGGDEEETDIWETIRDHEVHVSKYAQYKSVPVYLSTVGKWTGDGNWSSKDNLLYCDYYFTFEEVKIAAKMLVKSAENRYVPRKEYESDSLVRDYLKMLEKFRGSVAGDKFNF